MLQIVLQSFGLVEGQGLNCKVLLLTLVESAAKLIVDLGDLEVLPESSNAQSVIADINDFHERIVSLSLDPHLAFLSGLAFALEACAVGNFLPSCHC